MATIAERTCHRHRRTVPLHHYRDRAAVATTAILQIMTTAPSRQLRQQLEHYLRNEFAYERRDVIADRGLADA